MSYLIHNATIFTNRDGDPIRHGEAVAVDGTRIAAVGPTNALAARYPDFERIDGGGRLLMPGLTNAHMHYYGLFARGLDVKEYPRNFHDVLKYLWWSLDRALDEEAVYYSALVPAITAIRFGVTSTIDHHASPNAVDGSLDQIEKALRQVGGRALLCYEVSERDGEAIREAGLAENVRYMRKCQAARAADPDYPFDGMMGLHASFTVDDETLERAVGLADDHDRGVHIHMLEDFVDEAETRRHYHSGVLDRLYAFNVLAPKSIVAHGIYVDRNGEDKMAERGVILAHQAQSNMNNAVGRADIYALMKKGVRVGLGTDGMTADVRREIATGYLMHKHHEQELNLGWDEYRQMALKNNPRIYRDLTGQEIGEITRGYQADLILVDYFPPTELTTENFWGHFLFGIVDAPVDTTMVGGRIAMRGRVILGVDEAAVAAKAREVARQVWQRYYD